MTWNGAWVFFLATAGVMSILPWILLVRRRRIYAMVDVLGYAIIPLLVAMARILAVPIDLNLALILGGFLKIALFFGFLAAGPSSEILRFGPNIGFALAAVVYLALIPQILTWPIDGDEPFNLLITESIIDDFDLDLANQYANLEASKTGRMDLVPQTGDPVGRNGEQYSRHLPFLPLLLVPGTVIAGLPGAVVTIALLCAWLVRSIFLLLEEQGIRRRTVVLSFPLWAFGSPLLSYSTRLWSEVPAALCLTEALRGAGRKEYGRFALGLLGLGLLKLRFLPIAAVLALIVLLPRFRTSRKSLGVALAVLALPVGAVWMITGSPLNIHGVDEFLPQSPLRYLTGAFGLLLDGQAGLLLQAPFWLIGVAALFHWRSLPAGLRLGAISSIAYLYLLLPRAEWHGGWSPPLRYLVVFAPVLILGAAWLMERISLIWVVLAGSVTLAQSVHAVRYPWRSFHIANGESVFGELLSQIYGADFSRLVPGFIRVGQASVVWAAVVVVSVGAWLILRNRRLGDSFSLMVPGLLCVLIAGGTLVGKSPGRTVHFEDSHVDRQGGEMYPEMWTVARFLYTGGWRLHAGEMVSALYDGGDSTLRYRAPEGAVIEISGVRYDLPATGELFRELGLPVRAEDHRIVVRCWEGEVILDRIDRR